MRKPGLRDPVETARTAPHRRAEKVLDELGVGYVSECTNFPPYAVDLYVERWHAAIEIDGPRHARKADAERDARLLERYGLLVFRVAAEFKAYELKAVVEYISSTALADVEERKMIWRLSQ